MKGFSSQTCDIRNVPDLDLSKRKQVFMKSSLDDGTPKAFIKSSRLQWEKLPPDVSHGIEDIMGSQVSVASSQPGGYSPGTADRIITNNGQRFFVKAVGSPINDTSPDIQRKEIRVFEAVSDRLLGSGIVGTYDDGEWVAIVFRDIEGRHPDLANAYDRELVIKSLQGLTSSPLSPEAKAILPSLSDDVAYAFDAWKRIDEDPVPGLNPWIIDNFDRLDSLAHSASNRLAGDYLVHSDLRKDNILISGDKAFIVDWPWAAVGAPWFDALTVTIDAGLTNIGFNTIKEIKTNPLLASCSEDDIDSVISGMMGYFFDCARKPAPPGIPHLRKLQYDQGLMCLRLIHERWI